MSLANCLIALCLGYWIYTHSLKQESDLRLLGKFIGIFVMILAFLSCLCCVSKASCRAKYGWGKKSMTCPITGATRT